MRSMRQWWREHFRSWSCRSLCGARPIAIAASAKYFANVRPSSLTMSLTNVASLASVQPAKPCVLDKKLSLLTVVESYHGPLLAPAAAQRKHGPDSEVLMLHDVASVKLFRLAVAVLRAVDPAALHRRQVDDLARFGRNLPKES